MRCFSIKQSSYGSRSSDLHFLGAADPPTPAKIPGITDRMLNGEREVRIMQFHSSTAVSEMFEDSGPSNSITPGDDYNFGHNG